MENLHQYHRYAYSVGEVAALRDLFLGLMRGIKASRQYPPQHPIPCQFKQAFREQLRSYFELADRLAVQVSFDAIDVDGETIYRGAVGIDNIAHLLHRDGIRSLEIRPNVTEAEIESFFDAFVVCSSTEMSRTDIVNLFWQAGLVNIHCEVVDTFEPGELAEVALDLGEEASAPKTAAAAVEPVRTLNWPQPGPEAQVQAEQHRNFLVQAYGDITHFSEPEQHKLAQLLEEDRGKDLKTEVVQLLLQLCAESDNIQDLRLTTESLQAAFDRIIDDTKFEILIAILEHVRSLNASQQIDSPAARKRLVEFEQRCGDSVRLKMIATALNRVEEIELEPVRRYLSLLGWESLNSLIWMLGELSHYPARKMVCDLLAFRGAEKLDILGGAVFDSRWFVVRNVVWVLGEMKSERAISYLQKAAKHTDNRVRAEVVKAAAKIGGEPGAGVLQALLQDPVERVRAMALNELGLNRSTAAFKALGQYVRSKEFFDFTSADQRQFLEAFVRCGGDEAANYCVELAGRSGLFGKARLQRLQEAAIHALQFSDAAITPGALERLSEDARTNIAVAARRALKQLHSRLGGRHE